MQVLTTDPIDAAAVAAAVRSREAGAVVTFEGTVRASTHGREVVLLEYEAYPEMATALLREIAERVGARRGARLSCVHRTGRLRPGETAVVVAAAAPHRAEALAAVEEFVAALKRDVPIWKKEHFADGAVWVGCAHDPQGALSEPRR